MSEPLSASEVLLRVAGLRVDYRIGEATTPVVRNVSFALKSGEAVGLLGESGSGKTTTALALLRVLPANATISGRVLFRGEDLSKAPERVLRQVRGAKISFIPQEPLSSLNPVMRVIDQVAAVLRAHEKMSAGQYKERAAAVLSEVGLNTDRLQRAYPHQLSGGQRQRVLIAQAIVCRPSLIIADEPTGSLDREMEQAILELLRSLIQRLGASLFIITHDPRVLAKIADRVMVMYGGKIIETGAREEVLESPLHPYTRGLLACTLDQPASAGGKRDRHVPAMEGSLPDFNALPPGCSFEPRCHDRLPNCRETEPPTALLASHEVTCFLYGHSR